MLNGVIEEFAQRDLVLGWSNDERKRIEASISNLRYWLDKKLEVSETMVFGSWTRNTILPRKYDESSDIDLMVVFNGNLNNRDPEQCRNLLRNFVASGYPKSYVRKDFPAVKLELNFIKYDLVPAVKDEWTGRYYIPNTSQYSSGWMFTSPKDIDPKLSRINIDIGGNIARNIIRLCKYMNKSTGRTAMSSYELESYVLDRIQSISYFTPKRTYDYFLEVMGRIGTECQIFNPKSFQNVLDWIIYYRKQENISGQVTWIKHLLPNFMG